MSNDNLSLDQIKRQIQNDQENKRVALNVGSMWEQETDKAVKISGGMWLPKSQIKQYVYVVSNHQKCLFITIPQWLYGKNSNQLKPLKFYVED